MRSSIRKTGPTFFSDKTNLTYYVGFRKSGKHNLHIGRSKDVYEELSSFLESLGYDVNRHTRGHAFVNGIPPKELAQLINLTESDFRVD